MNENKDENTGVSNYENEKEGFPEIKKKMKMQNKNKIKNKRFF